MKKLILMAALVLQLFATSAFALDENFVLPSDDTQNSYSFVGMNGALMRFNNGPNNSLVFYPSTTFLGTENLADKLSGIVDDVSDLTVTVGGLGTPDLSTYVLKTTTVNGHALSANVSVTKTDVGLGSVDNTSDASKPISTATQTALNGKAATSHTHAAADISDASTVGKSVLTCSTASACRTAIGAGTSSVSLSAGTHITDGATNAVTSNATNYNLVSGLLGVADGLNSANVAQNDLAAKYNALAAKFNGLLDTLEANGIVAP